MGSITALASKWLHSSCAVRIFVDRVYLGSFCNRGGCRGAVGSVFGTLVDGIVVGVGSGFTPGDGAVVEMVDGTTLGDGAVVVIGYGPLGGDVVRAPGGRDVASIP